MYSQFMMHGQENIKSRKCVCVCCSTAERNGIMFRHICSVCDIVRRRN